MRVFPPCRLNPKTQYYTNIFNNAKKEDTAKEFTIFHLHVKNNDGVDFDDEYEKENALADAAPITLPPDLVITDHASEIVTPEYLLKTAVSFGLNVGEDADQTQTIETYLLPLVAQYLRDVAKHNLPEG